MTFFRKSKVLSLLYKFYKWLFVIPFLGFNTAFFGTLAYLLSVTLSPRIGSKIGGVWWARTNAFVTPMFVSVFGRENVDPQQSYVVVSNHQSQYDIFVLYGRLGIDFRWVMKQELRKVPFLGFSCEKVGHIFIDRSNTEKALASINAARKKVVNGTSVLFFPEGTRSLDGNMIPFKKGAFKFALQMGLPILPVSVSGTRDILPANTMDLLPGKAKLTIHPPVAIENYTDETVRDLITKVRESIATGLDAPQSSR